MVGQVKREWLTLIGTDSVGSFVRPGAVLNLVRACLLLKKADTAWYGI